MMTDETIDEMEQSVDETIVEELSELMEVFA